MIKSQKKKDWKQPKLMESKIKNTEGGTGVGTTEYYNEAIS